MSPGQLAALLGLAAAAVSFSRTAEAAGPLGNQGGPIATSAYGIDLFQGPVLAGSRPTALGGAFAGVAEGVDGNAVNSAAPAVRVPWSIDWFDYDWTAGLTFPGSLRATDFDNNGQIGFSYRSFLFATVGANLQFGAWGFGAIADAQRYSLEGRPSVDGAPPHLSATLTRGHVLASRAFFSGQLMLGAGIRFAVLTFDANDRTDGTGTSRALFTTSGVSPEAGVIWAPHGLPMRAALSGRAPVRSQADPANEMAPNADGDTVIAAMYLPSRIELPWEVEAGVTFQIGRRTLNVPWINPHDLLGPLQGTLRPKPEERTRSGVPREEKARVGAAQKRVRNAASREVRRRLKARQKGIARQKLLISASVLVSGSVRTAVGVESFLQQVVDRSGERANVTPRLGVETEPVQDWLQTRAGVYLEPTRFREGSPRLHATAGFDVRLLDWSVFGLFEEDACWRIGGAIDGARDYLGWGASAGLWH